MVSPNACIYRWEWTKIFFWNIPSERAREMAIIGKFVQATYPTAFQIYQLNVLTINFPSLLVIGNGSKKKFIRPKMLQNYVHKSNFEHFLHSGDKYALKIFFSSNSSFPCREWSNFREKLWKFMGGKNNLHMTWLLICWKSN